MITVTNDFKAAIKADTKQIKVYWKDQEETPNQINEDDDLYSIIIKEETSLLRTVMRYAEVKHYGAHNFLDKYTNIGFGVVLPDTSTEFIDYGSFKVIERKTEKGSDIVTNKLFDKMYESLQLWDLSPIYDISYPATLKELLEAICSRFSWTLGTETFPNDSTVITQDYLTGAISTYREALEFIAELSASMIMFDVNDELIVKQVGHVISAETLDETLLESLSIESNYGPINSLVLARTPQEDNIVDKDQTSIDADGLTEIKLGNNWIADSDRESWIEEAFDEINGLEFYPFEAKTYGLAYLQIGDRIILEDPSSNQFESVILGRELVLSGGITERFFADVPDKSNTNYNLAGIIGQRIKDTEIKVDKQEGVITATVSELDDISEVLTELIQDVQGLTLNVQGIGGINQVKNSAGLKGDLLDWQTIGVTGNPIDSDNNGTVLSTADIKNNTESNSGIQITDQFIQQNISVIPNEEHILYLRFKKTGTATVTINAATFALETEGYTDGDWDTLKYYFTPETSNIVLRFETSGGGTAILSDIVVKIGDTNGWMQAPNEIFGSTYRFDANGFEILSLTENMKVLINNTSFGIYNTLTDEPVILVSNDSSLIIRLSVEDFLAMNASDGSKGKLIPRAGGLSVTITE